MSILFSVGLLLWHMFILVVPHGILSCGGQFNPDFGSSVFLP
jgi:hypothetical protein